MGTYSTRKWPPPMSLEELAKMFTRMEHLSHTIANRVVCGPGSLDAIRKHFEKIPKIESRYEFDLAGIPIYSDPAIPRGEIRVLNADGEVIDVVTGGNRDMFGINNDFDTAGAH